MRTMEVDGGRAWLWLVVGVSWLNGLVLEDVVGDEEVRVDVGGRLGGPELNGLVDWLGIEGRPLPPEGGR